MTNLTFSEIAVSAGIEAVQRNQSMKSLWQGAFDAQGVMRAEMLGGLVGVTCSVVDAWQAVGGANEAGQQVAQQILNAPPHARRMLLSVVVDRKDQEAGYIVNALCEAIHKISDKISVTPAKVRLPPPPAPDKIAQETPAPPPAEPQIIKVEIVSMPARTTETTVTRDRDGNIKETVQAERDG